MPYRKTCAFKFKLHLEVGGARNKHSLQLEVSRHEKENSKGTSVVAVFDGLGFLDLFV